MAEDGGLAMLIRRASLPPSYERWQHDVAPGARQPASSEDWAGALVVIECGVIRVECLAGGSRTFSAGDVLALDVLPLSALFNPGPATARLIAVRRRNDASRGLG